MTDFKKTSLSPVEDGPPYDDIYNNTGRTSSSSDGLGLYSEVSTAIVISLPFICIIGLLGNGIVICLLGFHIRRTPFTTYILNLAVADFGVLLFFGLFFILSLINMTTFQGITFMAFVIMHGTSQLLLTAISIERCVSVLFPIWHRCHRPPHLSSVVCTVMWVLACLPSGSLAFQDNPWADIFSYPFIAGSALSLPLVTVCTMILLFKVFYKSQHPRGGRLLTIVLITLLFFLMFAFPLNAILTFKYFTNSENENLLGCGLLCACLNSFVNPVIYYMVGRKKRGQQRQSLKVILQRAFKEEEEEQKEEQGPTAQMSP